MTTEQTDASSGSRGLLTFVFVYFVSLLSMATVGVIIPNIKGYADLFQTDVSAIGFAVSLFSLPTALTATIAGGIIDRIGLRTSVGWGVTLFIAGSLLSFLAGSILMFDIALIIVGIGYVGIAVGGPAILMSALSGSARVRAMSILSTCPPTGYALGLLIAGPLVEGPYWHLASVAQIALMALLTPLIFILPGRTARVQGSDDGAPKASMLANLRLERRVLFLAAACALPGFISYGTSLVAPSYIASVHQVSLGTSSVTVAIVKVVVAVLSGLAMGQLLSRIGGRSKTVLYGATALIGLVAQFFLFLPDSSLGLSVISLFIWLIAFSGLASAAMASLPDVVSSPARAGLASGMVSQVISSVSFIAPTIYFMTTSWLIFVGLAMGGLLMAFLGMVASQPSRVRPAGAAEQRRKAAA